MLAALAILAVLSAFAPREPVVRAIALGQMDGFLPKPARTPDEQFHRLVTEYLDEWHRSQIPPFVAVRLVGERRACEFGFTTGPGDEATTEPPAKPSAPPTPKGPPPAGPALLSPGDTSAEVRDLQARLRQIDWFEGDVSDKYGPKTTEAVRGFQAKRGFQVTGKVDQRTLNRLHRMTRPPTKAELTNAPPPSNHDNRPGALDPRCTTGRVLCIDKSSRTLRWVVDGKVRIWSRNALEWTGKVPEIAAAIEQLGLTSAALDGELIAGTGARAERVLEHIAGPVLRLRRLALHDSRQYHRTGIQRAGDGRPRSPLAARPGLSRVRGTGHRRWLFGRDCRAAHRCVRARAASPPAPTVRRRRRASRRPAGPARRR